MKVHDRYTYAELEMIFDKTDLLIVPSVWYETFGFQVLEALSYGVPVLVSGNVGAQDILADGAGIVIENISADKLYDCLYTLTAGQLKQMNKVILEKQEIPVLATVARRLEKSCYTNKK